MATTVDQALALVDSMLKSSRTKGHLEAVLGLDRVAEVKDFLSRDRETLDRCEELLNYLIESCHCLLATIPGRQET